MARVKKPAPQEPVPVESVLGSEQVRELIKWYLTQLESHTKAEIKAKEEMEAIYTELMNLMGDYRSAGKREDAVRLLARYTRATQSAALAGSRVSCVRCTLAGLGWFAPSGFGAGGPPVAPF